MVLIRNNPIKATLKGDTFPSFSPFCWCLGANTTYSIFWTASLLIICVLSPLFCAAANVTFYMACDTLLVMLQNKIGTIRKHSYSISNGSYDMGQITNSKKVKIMGVIGNENVFNPAPQTMDSVQQITVPNSTFISGQSNFTSMEITGCSGSGSSDFSEIGEFSGSGSGDGEYTSFQPLTCSAPCGIKSEAIYRKFKHLMQNIYKARIDMGLIIRPHIRKPYNTVHTDSRNPTVRP